MSRHLELEEIRRNRAERERVCEEHNLSRYMQECLEAIFRRGKWRDNRHKIVALPEWVQRTTIDALIKRGFLTVDEEYKNCILTTHGKEVVFVLCQNYREELSQEQKERRERIFELAEVQEHLSEALGRTHQMLENSLYQFLRQGKLIEQVTHPVLGGYNCESNSNPLGKCVYEQNEDPAHDDCIFCHEPEERK